MTERRILVTGEDPLVRGYTQASLRSLCVEMQVPAVIESASSGPEAVGILKSSDYDVAVFDDYCADALHEMSGSKGTPQMIWYSNSADKSKINAAIKAGVQVIEKHSRGNLNLADTVRRHLGGRK
jgi:CheY-like chemotaxis protein